MDFGGNFPDDISDDSTSKAEDVLNTSSGEAEEMKFGGNFPVSNNSKRTSKPEEVLNRLAKLAELGVLGKASADRNAELAFVETVDGYEHPDFQSSIRIVMEEIEDQLDDIESRASPMDRHVWERLTSINVYLQSLSQCRQDLLRAVIALASSFKWSLVDRVNSMSLASRTVVSRGIGHRSLAFHHSIDHLLVRFDLPGAASRVHSWKHRWDCDHQLELSNFETVLKDPEYFTGLRDEDERIEVAALLAFEISRRRAIYSADTLNAMTHAMEALRGEVAAFPVLPRWFVPWHEIEVRGYISSGSFGSVHRGKWVEADVAVKQLFQADKDDFFHEVDVWFSLNHPNVIKLFGAYHVGTPFFLCEYAENGTLPKFARDQQWQDWAPSFYQPRNPVWAALYNAAKGLHHLHRRGVIHGDLKGNNILVGADRKAELTDFGLSVFAQNRDPQPNGPVGAVRWKAPERLRDVDNGPSFESDIFSFGMCIVELVSGRLPWINIEPDVGVREAVLQGKLPQRPPQFADDEWDLVLRMCCFDPSERIDSFSVVMILRYYVGDVQVMQI
ncbi:hypothetical protein PF003_g35958 [Phytophthora fragariae]|nr:hypothetical protein PF003_g35958 [Phytophthora fragariae]